MLKQVYVIDGRLAEQLKVIEHGYGTSDGIKMLGLPDREEYNYAGNTYLTALTTIKELLEELNKRA